MRVNEWLFLLSRPEGGPRHEAVMNSCTSEAKLLSAAGSNGRPITAAVAGFREPDSCSWEMDSKATEEMESCENNCA